MRILSLTLSLGLLLVSLSGCVPGLMFGAATTTTATVGEERGFGGAMNDSSIRARINMKWAAKMPALLTLVELSVREGRVMLAGIVDTPEQQIEAIRMVWEVSGVREVIDKIQVGEGTGFFGYMGDSWITTKAKASLLAHKNIHSVNYTVKTVKGVVFVMGIALSTKELEHVLTRIRNLSGVEKVVSYVRIKEQPTTGNMAFSQSGPSDPSGTMPLPPKEDLQPVDVQSLDEPNTGSSFEG